jgi:hypothetical protein
MIQNREEKIQRIVATIRNNIAEINRAPDAALYFYRKSIFLRNNAENIEVFLANDYNLEILYATLVSWGMNSRRAKIKYFGDFQSNIRGCLNLLTQLEHLQPNQQEFIPTLEQAYQKLELMQPRGRSVSKLVSNSKLLHFLFPKMLMPMDKTHILVYFYGNTGESINKYIEIVKLSFDVMALDEHWERYLDEQWNTTIPKMIDNAIFLLS